MNYKRIQDKIMAKQSVTITLDIEMLNVLKRRAKQENRSLSNLIEKYLGEMTEYELGRTKEDTL